MGFPVPQGTPQSFGQNVDGGIFIAVHHQSTRGTHMRPSRERFLHTLSTARTILTGVLWGDGDDRHIMHDAVGLHPAEELPPCRIMDALGQFVVFHQIADLKVFVGNQVVRRDQRVRRFAGEIFTLPLHASREAFARRCLAFFRFLLFFCLRDTRRWRRLSFVSALR